MSVEVTWFLSEDENNRVYHTLLTKDYATARRLLMLCICSECWVLSGNKEDRVFFCGIAKKGGQESIIRLENSNTEKSFDELRTVLESKIVE